MKKYFLFYLSFFCLTASANNLRISNVSLETQNDNLNTYQVKFDIAWDNSWRTSTFESNWDAAWVFLKFRELPSTEWQHGEVFSVGHVAPSGSTIDPSSDNMGVMIFRDSDGIGNVNFTNAEIRWWYGFNVPDDAVIEIAVMAIEMVYVPGGSFQLGDNDFSQGSFSNYTVVDEVSICLGCEEGIQSNTAQMEIADDFDSQNLEILPDAFPKGYNEFYCMKYEMTQGQWADFLNKLTAAQASTNNTNEESVGYGISSSSNSPFKYSAARPNQVIGHLSWHQVAAYADWSGLRPMTELEYEKACRGFANRVSGEYAWGNSYKHHDTYIIINEGMPNEMIQSLPQGTGNLMDPATGSNLRRAGILAASSVNKTRQETGGTYYGIMEMSGHLSELVINVGTSWGRVYTGLHGDGVLDPNGDHNVDFWPDISGIFEAWGVGLRGAGMAFFGAQISNRHKSNDHVKAKTNSFSNGGRLVRSGL